MLNNLKNPKSSHSPLKMLYNDPHNVRKSIDEI